MASELDKFLGPRKEPPPDLGPRRGMQEIMDAALAHKNDWHCEERLHAVLDAFIDEMGDAYKPRSPEMRRSLYASARAVVNEVGESPAFVTWGCHKVKQKLMIIKDLRSILFLAPEWREQRNGVGNGPICPICNLPEFYCDGHKSEDEDA